MEAVGGIVVVLAIFVAILLGSAIRVLREYERGVVFRLGRLIGVKGPGLILLVPIIDRMVRVDLRTVTLNIPPQEIITRDNVPTSVNAVCYFRVIDAAKAIVDVENYLHATSLIAQTALRSVLGKAELDQLLAERERLNEDLQKIIDESTEPWGVKVSTVEIKDVEIPTQMQRAMARQAEAERERRAKIINSEGEYQAAQKLTDAADIISQNPASIQLRYLQTLLEIGGNQNTTVVFPLPIDLIKPFQEMFDGNGERPVRPKPPRGPVPEVSPAGGVEPDVGPEEDDEAETPSSSRLADLPVESEPDEPGVATTEAAEQPGGDEAGLSEVAKELSRLIDKPEDDKA
jgi:regulator of protease activity HflC (stomatin/prohibitin superfamily)